MSPGGGRNQNRGGQGLGGVENRGDVAIEREGLSPSKCKDKRLVEEKVGAGQWERLRR